MNIKTLLIELEEVKRNLDQIENDPEYIRQKADTIYTGKKYTPDPEAIKAILDN